MFARLKRNNGGTLIELGLILGMIITVCIPLMLIPVIIKGNFWYSRADILNELKIDHPEVREILRAQTNVVNLTIFLVENQDKSRDTYTLDSDILFNYDLKKVDRKDSLEKATLKNK